MELSSSPATERSAGTDRTSLGESITAGGTEGAASDAVDMVVRGNPRREIIEKRALCLRVRRGEPQAGRNRPNREPRGERCHRLLRTGPGEERGRARQMIPVRRAGREAKGPTRQAGTVKSGRPENPPCPAEKPLVWPILGSSSGP